MKKKLLYQNYFIVTFSIFLVYGILYIFTKRGIPCVIHKITGLYCPGCGITRIFISLFKLNIYQAFRYNPLVFILLIMCTLYFLADFLKFKISKSHIKLPKSIYIILLIIVILFGILRNIPLFSYLAPTIVN